MSQFTKLIQIVTAAIQKWVSSTSSLGNHSYKITLSYWCGIVTLVINSIILFIDHVILTLYHTYTYCILIVTEKGIIMCVKMRPDNINMIVINMFVINMFVINMIVINIIVMFFSSHMW